MEKGGIALYIENLHGFDKDVTNIMVNSWKAGHVKIDGVSHQVNADIIAEITKIPNERINFYRDKKLSANALRDFTKDAAERKKLVKVETYYKMDSIKKLWRYVLQAVIEFISLDTRFDRVRTHHFMLLNHF